MSCSNRNNAVHRNLELVRLLAQKTADLVNCPQKIYKIHCDGVMVYKFSDTWKGEVLETVNPIQFSGNDTSKSILPNTEDRRSGTFKSTESKSGKKGTLRDME